MPLVSTDCRASIKARLGIDAADTTWDSLISTFITDNVKRLFPRLQVETDKQVVTISPTNGEAHIDLSAFPTPLTGVRRVEVNGVTGEYPIHDVYQHKNDLRLRGLLSDVTEAHLYGLVRPTLANLDDEYHMVMILLGMSEFYNYLVGDKRKYNEYMSNGAPTVDEMADLGKHYQDEALALLDQIAPYYGR